MSAPPHSAFLSISNRGFCASASSPPHSASLLSRIFMFYHSTPSIRFVLSWRGRFPFRRFSVSASPPPHPVFHVSACVWFHSVFRVGGRDFGSGRIAGARGDRASYLAFSVRRRYLPPLCADWCTMAAQPYRRLNTGESWILLVRLFNKRRHLTGQRGQPM